MLAAMVAIEQPLCKWLRGFFDALGVSSEQITKGRKYHEDTLYPVRTDGAKYLATTNSFRTAFRKAAELRNLASPDQPIGLRHFMAAYAVCRDYHLRDFRSYRIDRREWCLQLSDELITQFPTEAERWDLYRDMAPDLLPLAFDNDTPDGRDHLHLEREVSAFARLITARSTSTPLAIGVFGAPYRVCMTQLAVLNADRDRAMEMIASLDSERSAITVGEWLDSFEPSDAELAAFLRAALGDVDRMDLDEFRLWLERTRRYSFYL